MSGIIPLLFFTLIAIPSTFFLIIAMFSLVYWFPGPNLYRKVSYSKLVKLAFGITILNLLYMLLLIGVFIAFPSLVTNPTILVTRVYFLIGAMITFPLPIAYYARFIFRLRKLEYFFFTIGTPLVALVFLEHTITAFLYYVAITVCISLVIDKIGDAINSKTSSARHI